MQSVIRSDPAPSRMKYRLERLMLTPLFRVTLRVGLPLVVIFGGAGLWFSSENNRDAFNLMLSDIRSTIEERPEFQLKLMAIDGASLGVAEDIREILPVDFPISSFDLDLDEMRDTILQLDAVKKANVRIRQGGILQVEVTERVPAVLWRNAEGLDLLDPRGVLVGSADSRLAHADLPVVAGDGAEKAIPEALALFAAIGPLAARLRGFERMGERRWDVVLDRGQRLLLPEIGAVQALERAIAMDQAVDMLSRDLTTVDLRLPQRPTLRMTDTAAEDMRRIKAIEAGDFNQ